MQRRRTVWFLVVLAALGGGLWWLFAGGGDWQVAPPRLFGRVWTTGPAQPALLLFVTREERQRSLRINKGNFRTQSYDRYALQVRRAADGLPLQAQGLGDYTDRQEALAPQILGVVGDVVWLWRDGPEALDLPTLALRCDTARWQREAPELAALLPQQPKGFAVRSEPRSLLMRGRDARLYTVDALQASLTPLAAEDLPTNTFSMQVEDRFDYLLPPGRSRVFTHPYNVLERSFLTRTGQWYALLADAERKDLTDYAPSGRPHGDVARRLHRAAYIMNGRSPQLDLATVEALGEERLLQAGFLIRSGEALWDVPEPSSTLALAKPLLGDDEPWQVVRLSRDGVVLWRTSTELADLGELLDLGTHVLFVGQRVASGRGDRAARDVRERLVWIDERSGARRTLFVATGELDPPVGP